MTLQTQEQHEPAETDVIRLAQQMLERDRARESRQSSLIAAAEEVGIPADYMAKATAQLKAEHAAELRRRADRRSPVAAVLALAVGFMIAVALVFSLVLVRPRPVPPATVAPPQQVTAPLPQASTRGAHMDAAYVLLEQGQWDAAAAEARAGIAETPHVADLHWALGKALFQKKDFTGALNAAEEARRLNPGHTAFPLLAGEIHLRTGNRKAAEKAWKAVLELDQGKNTWDAQTARNLMGQAGMRQ